MKMGLYFWVILLYFVLAPVEFNGLPLGSVHPVDDVIRLQLLEFNQGASLANGLVLAGTIVEGGPVFGRRRKILGGKYVHPGLRYYNTKERVDSCPSVTLGYRCVNWVPLSCQVVRHLIYRSRLCTCKVNVC